MTAIIVACIAALAPTIAVIVGYMLTNRKVREIHVAVNSNLEQVNARLDLALAVIASQLNRKDSA